MQIMDTCNRESCNAIDVDMHEVETAVTVGGGPTPYVPIKVEDPY